MDAVAAVAADPAAAVGAAVVIDAVPAAATAGEGKPDGADAGSGGRGPIVPFRENSQRPSPRMLPA